MYGISSSEIPLGPFKKMKKKIVFNTSQPLIQHPLGGILRRVALGQKMA